jgi:hypothetical protein
VSKQKEETVFGLSRADVRDISEQIFNRTDTNHPQIKSSDSGFINIIKNGKPDISASSVFIKKVSL